MELSTRLKKADGRVVVTGCAPFSPLLKLIILFLKRIKRVAVRSATTTKLDGANTTIIGNEGMQSPRVWD